MNPNMDVLSNKAIYINKGMIQEIGVADDIRKKYNNPSFIIELDEHDIVIPGLINTHIPMYACQHLVTLQMIEN